MSYLLKRFIILTAAFILFYPVISQFFHEGLYKCYDGEFHLAKTASYSLSYQNGNIVPRWGEHLAKGYGLPSPLLSYTAPYYLQLPFIFFGLDLINSYKLVTTLMFVLMLGIFFGIVKRAAGSFQAFIASALIAYSPYLTAQIFNNCSLGQIVGFLAVMLVLVGIRQLAKEVNPISFAFACFSWAILVLAQPMFPLVFGFMFLGYLAFCYLKTKGTLLNNTSNYLGLRPFVARTCYLSERPKDNKLIIVFGLSIITGYALSLFNLLPLLREIKYTHFAYQGWDGSNFSNFFVPAYNLAIPEWEYFFSTSSDIYPLFIGFSQFLIVLIGLFFVIKKRSSKYYPYLLLGLFIFLTSLFFNLPVSSPFYHFVPYLKNIQFPWRFMGPMMISFSFIYIGIIYGIPKKWRYIFSILILIGAIASSIIHIGGREYKKSYELPLCHRNRAGETIDTKGDNCFYYQLVDDPDWGLVSVPIWAAEPKLYPRPVQKLEILDGIGTIHEIINRDVHKQYAINFERKSILIFRTFYFPGWIARLDGTPLEIEFQNLHFPGLMLVHVPPGNHILDFQFERTKTRIFADTISEVTLFILIAWLVLKTIKRKYLKQKKELHKGK